MPSKYNLCSESLVSLGELPITGFLQNSDAARICGLIYPSYIKNLLCIYPWYFNEFTIQLARLSEAPQIGWKYSYQLPPDLLVLKEVYASAGVGAQIVKEYAMFGSKLLSNHSEIYIKYQAEIEAEDFPSYFYTFAVEALAYKLAIPITQDINIERQKKINAFGFESDNMGGGSFGLAKRVDSMQRVPQVLDANILLLSRL